MADDEGRVPQWVRAALHAYRVIVPAKRTPWVPQPLNLPYAESVVIEAPIDLVDQPDSQCRAVAQVMDAVTFRAASLPTYEQVRCERRAEHAGPHVVPGWAAESDPGKIHALRWGRDALSTERI